MELKDRLLEFLNMKETNLSLMGIDNDYDDGYYDGKIEMIKQVRKIIELENKAWHLFFLGL